MPKPRHTVNGNIANDTVDNYVKKAIEDLQVGDDPSESAEKFPWPEKVYDEPVSDFSNGYFSKCFYHLFLDGMDDISNSRLGDTPTLKKWLRHLLKVDRRFVKDPQFILVVTNIMQKKKALSLGNLYVNRCLKTRTLKKSKKI